MKIAQTLDGRIASATGQSRWISCPESRRAAHRLRAEHDAVLVGIGTVLTDDPRLTVRNADSRDPLRLVLDTHLRIPLDCHLVTDAPENTLIVTALTAPLTSVRRLQARCVRVLKLPVRGGAIHLPALLEQVPSLGIGSLLVEGGKRVFTSFLAQRLVDEVAVFVAPKLLGAGIDAVGELGILDVNRSIYLTSVTTELSGVDILFRARLDYGPSDGNGAQSGSAND